MNRYNPVHDDAMVADENGTHVRYADHVRALSGFVAGTPKGAAMESVDAIAQKLIPCTCGGYGENKRRHMSDCPRHSVAWEDIAAALTAERERFAAFAGPDGEPRNVLGTLPITADGAIAIPFMSVVYHPDHPTRTLDVDVCQDEVIGQVGVPGDDCTEWHEYAIRDCYSTRTAAEAAKEKEPNK